MTQMLFRRALAATCVLLVGGCDSRPSRVRQADLDAAGAGLAAVAACDGNGDGLLSKQELQACPAIAQAMAQYDTDGDRQVTHGEITARIEKWQQLKVGLMGFSCRVTFAGQPLSGAMVRLVPEPFLDDVLPEASGTTNEAGLATPCIPSESQPDADRPLSGMYPGLYKVEITHPTIQVSPRYNSQTTLGQQVAPDDLAVTEVVYALTKNP
jgi:hypothetical protein